ncbi:MAG TPA: hypothetical protein VLT59_16660, partial [Steroidobacteraceae bacterium]|nr:hypothetical protein [Steroidobacteraceae bacterium]
DDGEEDAPDGDGGAGLDDLLDDLSRPKRGAVKPEEPAWRKLERYLEEKRTAELLSDFDDYDIDDDGGRGARRRRAG